MLLRKKQKILKVYQKFIMIMMILKRVGMNIADCSTKALSVIEKHWINKKKVINRYFLPMPSHERH